MAVRWRCPACGAATIEPDPLRENDHVQCAECRAEMPRSESLCCVCDSPDPWRARGTVHVQCQVCGTTQMIFADIRATG